MIKTAQKRFILITLSILLAVFSVIFVVMWRISSENFAKETNDSLQQLEHGYETSDDRPMRLFKPALIVSVYAYNEETSNYTVDYASENFTETKTQDIITYALSRESESGNVHDVYFSKKRQGAKMIIFAVDMSAEVSLMRSLLIKNLLLLSLAFIALSVVVWGLSAKVFQPIKTILAKQKQFISDASHELKTPVSIIAANTDVIRTEENKQYADSIKKQVDRLNFLVSDLLTLARLDEGNFKSVKENFNLSDEVTQIALSFDAVAFEKGKNLICDVDNDVYYEGAKDAVKQILHILLANAVKYADKNGNIKVSLKKSGSRIILSVYNDGSLIKDEDSDKIFERFYRGDASRSRESGGNGLGLSIAKSIATANKWNIFARSVYKKSMTVSLVI